MKHIGYLNVLLLFTLTMGSNSHGKEKSQFSKNHYFGETPPGLTPQPFAPGIVNTEKWGDSVGFSPDVNTIYVKRWRHSREVEQPESHIFKNVANQWHKTLMPDDMLKPFYSPDGQTQYHKSKYRERTADGWSEWKSLGQKFEEVRIMGLTTSAEGTLVFDENARHKDGYGTLFYSRLIDGKREDPKPLPKEINTGRWNAHPFIAPDESYILWDGEREDGYGEADLFVSFRQKDGSWGDAVNLGSAINTEVREGGPTVSPDGKYLFFNRMVPRTDDSGKQQSDVFWVSAQIIEDLKNIQ